MTLALYVHFESIPFKLYKFHHFQNFSTLIIPTMKFNNVAVLAASSLFSATTVQAQHDQTYTLSYNTAQNQFITSIGGRLQIPALPSTNGQYNIRSGVNSADNSGKLATVLSSDSGSWAATSAWYELTFALAPFSTISGIN